MKVALVCALLALGACHRADRHTPRKSAVAPAPPAPSAGLTLVGAKQSVLVADAPGAGVLAIDQDSLYWVRFVSLDHGTVMKVPKHGGPTVTLTELDENLSPEIALSRDSIFFQSTLGPPLRLPKTGGTAAVLADSADPLRPGKETLGFTADADHVYWFDRGSWDDKTARATPPHIFRGPVDGGNGQQLAEEWRIPLTMVPTGDGLYWVVGDYSGSAIRRAAPGAEATVVESKTVFSTIAVDAEWIYWLSSPTDELNATVDAELWRVSRRGGDAVRVATGPFAHASLAAHDGHAYVVRWNEASNTATLVEETNGQEALVARVSGALWGPVVDDSGLYAWHDRAGDSRDIVRVSR